MTDTQSVTDLYKEIKATYAAIDDLAKHIRQAKEDIASIKPKDIGADHIPQATDELDAVVTATEEATNKIMDVCDEITAIADGCAPEVKEKLIACTTKVFEACNFQDITGQRITKVVATLKYIDDKVEALIRAFDGDIYQSKDAPSSGDPDKKLLNGPQLSRDAPNQSEIDSLLSG